MKSSVQIVPITPQLAEQVSLASADDGGHHAPLATHAFVRDGRVIGATALFAPCQTFWAHSRQMHARESFDVIARCARSVAARAYLVLCGTDSPFHPYMTRLGYRPLGNADVFQHAP